MQYTSHTWINYFRIYSNENRSIRLIAFLFYVFICFNLFLFLYCGSMMSLISIGYCIFVDVVPALFGFGYFESIDKLKAVKYTAVEYMSVFYKILRRGAAGLRCCGVKWTISEYKSDKSFVHVHIFSGAKLYKQSKFFANWNLHHTSFRWCFNSVGKKNTIYVAWCLKYAKAIRILWQCFCS